MELLALFLQRQELLPLFLERQILFGPSVLFYLLNLISVLQAIEGFGLQSH